MENREERMKKIAEELEKAAATEEQVSSGAGAEIFRLARELGAALKKDARMQKLENAKKEYEEDEQLQKILTEYEVQQKALAQLAADPSCDKSLPSLIQNRIDELYELILNDPSFRKLTEAQEEANALMDAVNRTIAYCVNGKVPECTHDCSTCGAGCHSGDEKGV